MFFLCVLDYLTICYMTYFRFSLQPSPCATFPIQLNNLSNIFNRILSNSKVDHICDSLSLLASLFSMYVALHVDGMRLHTLDSPTLSALHLAQLARLEHYLGKKHAKVWKRCYKRNGFMLDRVIMTRKRKHVWGQPNYLYILYNFIIVV